MSLNDNFPDPEKRGLAVRVFWCVYVLDRRWSFGTSLSFALADRDIDPNLPEPVSDDSMFICESFKQRHASTAAPTTSNLPTHCFLHASFMYQNSVAKSTPSPKTSAICAV